jgi:mRNA turnover protein 4
VFIPPGEIYAPPSANSKDDGAGEEMLPVVASREPELRKLGVPTRLVKGKVMCEVDREDGGVGEGYRVCRRGEVLDSRQTALLKFLGVRMSRFKVTVRAGWSAGSGEVEEFEGGGEEGMDVDDEDVEEE